MLTPSRMRNVSKTDSVLLDTQQVVEAKQLVQRLISQAYEHLPATAPSDDRDAQEEILLDVEVDGVRCLLIRTRPKSILPPVSLSPREQEIARMVAKGYPNKTIAAVLEISAWTVCTHLRRIFAKLGVGSRAAMVAKLMEDRGILAGNGTGNGRE